MKLQEEQLSKVSELTGPKNWDLAKKHLLDLKVSKRDIYIRCLAAAFLAEESLEITNKIFEQAEKSYFTASDIFYSAHQLGTLKNFLKK